MLETEWNDKREKFGKISFKNGDLYEGQIKISPNLLVEIVNVHGDGKMEYNDGARYEGTFSYGFLEVGRYTYPNGDYFEGSFIINERHEGIMYYSCGDIFTGRWYKDKLYEGIMEYVDGTVYNGEWYENMKHGMGTIIYADGGVYSGRFEFDYYSV